MTSMLGPCLFRADADARMGAGHVMRCLALAQTVGDAGERAVFLMAPGATNLEDRLRSEGMTVRHLSARPGSDDDAAETTAVAREEDVSWIVVDGYHFDATYQHRLKASDRLVLFLDDTGHADEYVADMVLNQNAHASESLYANRDAGTRLLLGTDYFLLRKEFAEYRGQERMTPDAAHRVLVTMGGGDQHNVTRMVLRSLQRVEAPLQVRVIVGSANPHGDALRSEVGALGPEVELQENVTDVPAQMIWAELAVTAGGGTCWEMAFLGLPALVVVTADNQRGVAGALQGSGAAVSLGWWEELDDRTCADALRQLIDDRQAREEMCRRGRRLIDGRGAERCLIAMREVSHAASCHR